MRCWGAGWAGRSAQGRSRFSPGTFVASVAAGAAAASKLVIKLCNTVTTGVPGIATKEMPQPRLLATTEAASVCVRPDFLAPKTAY